MATQFNLVEKIITDFLLSLPNKVEMFLELKIKLMLKVMLMLTVMLMPSGSITRSHNDFHKNDRAGLSEPLRLVDPVADSLVDPLVDSVVDPLVDVICEDVQPAGFR